jgi:hypothetical protein
MAVNYVKGQILSSTLERDGNNLSITDTSNSTPTLYIDVVNSRVGVNTAYPTVTLQVVGNTSVSGNIYGANAIVPGSVFTPNVANLTGAVDITANTKSWQFSDNGNVYTPESGQIRASSPLYGISMQDYSSNSYVYLDAVEALIQGNNFVRIQTNSGTQFNFSNGLLNAGSANITGGNLIIGNKLIPTTGNINVANVNINNVVNPVQSQDAATKYYVDYSVANVGNIGNLTFSNTTISTSLTNGNIILTPTGTGLAVINTTTGLVLPVGNTAQQPSPAATGTVRFNTTTSLPEVYNGNTWSPFSAPVTNQTLNGDGSTYLFTLNRSTTTAAVLIMLNGITQVPNQAYAMSPDPSTNLVFTEAPAPSDVIDIRFL